MVFGRVLFPKLFPFQAVLNRNAGASCIFLTVFGRGLVRGKPVTEDEVPSLVIRVRERSFRRGFLAQQAFPRVVIGRRPAWVGHRVPLDRAKATAGRVMRRSGGLGIFCE